MEKLKLLYSADTPKEHIHLSEEDKQKIENITLGIDVVDEYIRSKSADDVVNTLENNHPLNRLIKDEKGEIIGYLACEDFVPNEAYIKYFGTSSSTNRNLLQEIPSFLETAKSLGYSKINFHGWNDRLNHILTRYGFNRIKTDKAMGFEIDFYEKSLIEEKSQEEVSEERIKAFEQKYLNKLEQDYNKTLNTFSNEIRFKKELDVEQAFNSLNFRLSTTPSLEYQDRQKAVLKLKLARYFQKEESLDINVLYDAIIESPKFIDTDKGSLKRLLEVHEEKTIQIIAERRKQRAEMGEGSEFNPYEALFSTKSGNYYLARLLNMPHLEKESDYMFHCVGHSDSYINKIKRGDVEILSFRKSPKINPKTQMLEGDKPIITIEYNLKTKVIEQIKKAKDKYINQSDPFFSDFIDALNQLKQTKTDLGETRDFKSISDNELREIQVADYNVFTSEGEISFRDYDSEKHGIILKKGKLEVATDTTTEDAVKMVNIVGNYKYKPHEIALSPQEVKPETKVYIGELDRDVFNNASIEHVYTRSLDHEIKRFELKLSGKSGPELQKDLEAANIEFWNETKFMLKSPEFEISPKGEIINLVHVTARDLGFTESTTYSEIIAKAKAYGLELCPPDTGPNYRLKYKDQPLNKWFRIGMKPITDPAGDPAVFYLERHDDGLWLSNVLANPGDKCAPDSEIVFRLRKSEA